MKLVSFVEFCELPRGTVFQELEPCFLGDLCIRGDVVWNEEGKPIDFYSRTATPTVSLDNGGACLVWQEQELRWGNFRYSSRFVVYEPDDKQFLVKRLYMPYLSDNLEDMRIVDIPEEE